ncbi:flagellar type III secretion system pore protein FliP [Nocardioides perillae]|uniref:Flagellar biosynthetic protein FliP n=1 Tax=Nocardioides perillae TaxID=1119534 RepID=A0A7Y9RXE5_9ACTN|nr:flagellar biosynthetic protein FliP [Nocardioides perillae]
MTLVRRAAATLAAVVLGVLLALVAAPAQAQPTLPEPTPGQTDGQTDGPAGTPQDGQDEPGVDGPAGPTGPGVDPGDTVSIDLTGLSGTPSTSVTVIIGLTLLSLLPAILLTCTSFTKILIVLGLTRNALGLQQTPNNQVLAGLALFLSLFIMGPVLSEINEVGLQPYLDGDKTTSVAFEDGLEPLREFMLDQTDSEELTLLTNVAGRELPEDRADVPTATLIPAFVLSELKQAFVIGFIIFIPFLVIDIVVSGALMALGMMMMPPVMVSLPFKLLLFVMVDGWALIIRSLVASYG